MTTSTMSRESQASSSSPGGGGINYHAVFNAKLIDFLEDLRGILGSLPDYKVLVSSARLMAQFQERQNAKLFNAYVTVPYGTQILARDEAFFVCRDYDEFVNKTASSSKNTGDVVQLLKGVWNTLPQEDRDSIWAHLHVLVTLSSRCQ